MRRILAVFLPMCLFAQQTVEPLESAYKALKAQEYQVAIRYFLEAVRLFPDRAAVRKDLAYTYLKIGENESARDQFYEAVRIDSSDFHAALEYAFLCFETNRQAEARRVFDHVRKAGDPASRVTAEQAFQNIDQPLGEGIARWSRVVTESPGNFSAHFELATLAEQRSELELAATHYRKAWSTLPQKKYLLVHLGRVLQALKRQQEAMAALLTAVYGGETRASEAARDLLPERFPYVNEFRQALELDPRNTALRRELAFLLLELNRQPEAEREFRLILDQDPADLLACAQLGLLFLARDERSRALPLLDKVLAGTDAALAGKIRAVLRKPEPAAGGQPGPVPVSTDPKVMAERSFQEGYLLEALRYLQLAHEADRQDLWVQVKLGWTYNLLHDDREALHWFDMARRGNDPGLAAEADKAYHNLRPQFSAMRTTVWALPMYSSRWNDLFSYGQVKTDFRLGSLPFRPYLSVRFLGDVRRRAPGRVLPQFLSENSIVLAAGAATPNWKGVTLWGEAGRSVTYLKQPQGFERSASDYRGGINFGRGFGPGYGSEGSGAFFETLADGVFFSRFDNTFLVYSQNRWGYRPKAVTSLGGLEPQLYWAGHLTLDAKRQDWANFVETGPGVRFRWPQMPRGLALSVESLRGVYTVSQHGGRAANFFDVRAGFWYAITR